MINLENLKKGRDYLARYVSDEKFSMDRFLQDKDGDEVYFGDRIKQINCKTIGCALGWIAMTPAFRSFVGSVDGFNQLSRGLLGIDSYNSGSSGAVWSFLFDSEYSEYDNTRAGAIGRIDVILKYPDLFDEVEDGE